MVFYLCDTRSTGLCKWVCYCTKLEVCECVSECVCDPVAWLISHNIIISPLYCVWSVPFYLTACFWLQFYTHKCCYFCSQSVIAVIAAAAPFRNCLNLHLQQLHTKNSIVITSFWRVWTIVRNRYLIKMFNKFIFHHLLIRWNANWLFIEID